MTKNGAGQESMEEQPRTSCCSSSSSTSSSLSISSSHAGSNTPSTSAAAAAAAASAASAICPPPTSSSTSGEAEQRQPCQSEWGKDLVDQCWYWGATAKEELSAAMENQANGTFAVRDASTKGQYTLTLRLDGSNKLIKILVHKDKCGFTADCMDFDSIPSLVQFYRTCSLRDFNDRLDTCLLCPLTAPSWLAREAALKSKPQIDPQYQICLLKCRLEGLHAEYDRISRRYDQLFGQQSALADEHKRKRQTASAYADALKIFERKIGELKKTMLGEEAAQQLNLNEREREALAMNIELQEERMEEIGKAQCLMNTAIQNIGRTLARIDEELEELKPRLLKLHKRRDKCRDKLLAMPKQQVTHAQLDRLVQAVSLALDSEPSSLSAFLLRTPLAMPRWDCEQWLWHQATKEQSIALVKSLLPGEPLGSESANRREDDGIFLIRPSSSRPGFYALEISKTGIVHSCLVEYRDPRATALPLEHLCGGYGFAQTQMLFPSLVDFVRYYSVVPLKEHNSVLDTPLITPALGLHKRAQRKKRAAAEQHDRRAPAPTTGDEPPQPTGT